MKTKVIERTKPEHLGWSFDQDPVVHVPRLAPWAWDNSMRVDPFPCYTHDVTLVKKCLADVVETFPLRGIVQVAILGWESVKRTNGECDITYHYEKDRKEDDLRKWGASIRLWGKRIPPHPAMTRYLVSHEYGHAVARECADQLNYKETDEVYRDYLKLRPVPKRTGRAYGGGTWHLDVGEIFANDFRLLIAGAEGEFWPHTAPRPDGNRKLIKWWQARVEQARQNP